MRRRRGRQFDIWLVNERDDPATFPPWLAEAVKDRFEDGLFVLTSDAGVIEARPGDLIVRDGDDVRVQISEEVESRSARPSSYPEIAPTFVSPRPSERGETDWPRPQGVHGVFAVLAVTFFLGLLSFALAWLMIRLIGHDRSPL